MKPPLRTVLLYLAISLPLMLACCSDDEPADGKKDTGAATDASRDSSVDAPAADQGVTPDASPDLPTAALPAPVLAVEAARYETDLKFIAQIRPPGSTHWKAVQDLCAQRLTDLGYTVVLHNYATGTNVIGTLTGKTEPNKRVVISAHYDHIPGCMGADDNATGVAGVLETARVLAAVEHDRTLVMACWDEEEWGMIGAHAYVADALAAGDEILMSYVYEMIGYRSDEPNSQLIPDGFDMIFPAAVNQIKANDSRGDFVGLIYDVHTTGNSKAAAAEMLALSGPVGLPAIELPVPKVLKMSVPDLRMSDHDAFWAKDLPAMMITDTAYFRNLNYHCKTAPDSVDRLDHAFAAKVVQLTVGSALKLLQAN